MKKSVLLAMFMAFMGIINAQSHYWTPITGNQYNMTVTGIIVIDDVAQTSTTLEIGAFCGDECRASSFAQLFPPTGDYVVTMTIRSRVVSGEVITFRLYDHDSQQELDLDCESTVDFVANTNIGSLNNWFHFTFMTPPIHNIVSGSWSNPNIWNIDEIPGADDEVIISNDCTVDIDVEVAALTVSDGAVLTIQAGNTLTVNGSLVNDDEDGIVIEDRAQVINGSAGVKATAKKDIQAYTAKDNNGWHLIASSVDEMEIAGSDFLNETYDLYRYNEAMPGWENYRAHYNTDFKIFENGRGYLYANSNTFSPEFKGILNNTDITYPLTYTESKSLVGVNIIGNPFPHVIYKGEGGAIDNAKLASGYFALEYDGTWMACTYDDPIMPGQGILVRTTENLDLSIEKTNVEATGESSTSKAKVGRMEIMLSCSDSDDRAFAYFGDGIGLEKMDNLSESLPTLGIRDNGTDYAIAHVSEQPDEMEIIFKNSTNDDFTIEIELKDIDFEYLHLIDNATGNDIDLLLEPSYTFHSNGNEIESRFKIVFRDTTGIDENSEITHFAYIAGENIIVTGEGTLEIIDMTGRIVKTIGIYGVERVCASSLQNGMYILRVINGNNVKTQKIVVR